MQKIRDSIEMHKQTIADCTEQIPPLEKVLKSNIARVEQAKDYLAKLKVKIKEFKLTRKKDGEGIESNMVTILNKFKIEIRAYHGGTLHGKGVRKLMTMLVRYLQRLQPS